MLSTPDLSGLEPKFGRYFARATDILLTGHFYDLDTTAQPWATTVGANTTVEFTFALNGIVPSDTIIATKPSHQTGLGVVGARCIQANQLGITLINATASPIAPANETWQILVIRRERE